MAARLVAAWTTLVMTRQTGAFTVFDCSHPDTTYQAIDLLEPARCADPEKDFERPHNVMIQLVQTTQSVPIKGYRCKLTTTREVTTCGFTSISYGSRYTEWQKDVHLTPKECRATIRNRILEFEGRKLSIELDIPGGNSWFTHGNLGPTGHCTHGDFFSGGIHFDDAYERLELQWEFTRINGVVDTTEGEVVFENGLRTEFEEGILRDAQEGVIVWTVKVPMCSQSLSGIYTGRAALHKTRGGRKANNLRGSIVMIAEGQQYAGLVLRKKTRLCGNQCYPTHIPNIMVCVGGKDAFPSADFRPQVDTARVNAQTQISHLHLATNLKMYHRFEEVQADLCVLDRKILHNKLQALSGASNPYALMDLYGRGHKVYVAGAVAYVARCVPMEATRYNYPNCTAEIPIEINGTRLFADAHTWVMQEFPTIVPCSDIMPVRWKVGPTWYCSFPEARQCGAPLRLNTTALTYTGGGFTEGLGRGVYSDEQLKQHKFYVLTQSTRAPAIAKVTNAVAYGHGVGGGMGLSIPGEDFPLLSANLEGYLYPQLAIFGHGWHFFVGFLLVVMIVKVILGSIVRAWVLYRERGLGWWVIASLWHTAFLVVRTPLVIVTKAVEELVEPLEKLPDHRSDDHSLKVRYYSAVQSDLEKLKEESDATDWDSVAGDKKPFIKPF